MRETAPASDFMNLHRMILILLGIALFASSASAANEQLGIDVLEQHQFAELKGKRVGLITNGTGIDSKGRQHDRRSAPRARASLWSRSSVPSTAFTARSTPGRKWARPPTRASGLPVYSLYGATKKPTPEMLKGIDVLVYDIQDIGCRSYTFISTLGLAMEAAGEAGIKFCVLDRPNPLNGNRVEGMMLDPKFRSFTAQWDIPYVYGLTPGELAYMIHSSPGWIKKVPPLTIVSMVGWYRSMYWKDTGLMWVPTSPHIPTADSAFNYVATGFLGEAGGVSNGVGYTLPFGVFGHPGFDAFALTDQMNQMHLPGVQFRADHLQAVLQPVQGAGRQRRADFLHRPRQGEPLQPRRADSLRLLSLAGHEDVPCRCRRRIRPEPVRPRSRHERPARRAAGRQDAGGNHRLVAAGPDRLPRSAPPLPPLRRTAPKRDGELTE